MYISYTLLPVLAAGALLTLTACSSRHAAEGSSQAPAAISDTPDALQPVTATINALGSAPRALPKAILYRMSGPYALNVPVQLAPDGRIMSYPAPSDIPDNPVPLRLAEGWWLSPLGITGSSAFLRYTYKEYKALPEAPTPSELLLKVIPGAGVTEILATPFTLQQALADTAAVNQFIHSQTR